MRAPSNSPTCPVQIRNVPIRLLRQVLFEGHRQYYQQLSLSRKVAMNFMNFLTQSTSLLNFNLSSNVPQAGSNPSNIQVSTPKRINPEQIIKEPSQVEQLAPEQVASGQQKEGGNKESQVEMFTVQQQLINQYMHLNIQLLSKKLQNLEQVDKTSKQEEPSIPEVKNSKKKIKKVNNCGHSDREHYAKGMCNNCYHKYGRNKKPWNCSHDKLYANGMCQNCYINTYNRKRREEKLEDVEAQGQLKIQEEEK